MLYFDGANDALDIGHAWFPWGTNTVTIVFWFKNDSDTTWRFMGAQSDGVSGLGMDCNVGGNNKIRCDKIGVETGVEHVWTPDDNWHHLGFVTSSAGCFLCFDGALVDSDATKTANFLDPGRSIYIGARNLASGWGDGFKGIMGEVQFYDRALSLAEIITRMYRQAASEANMLAYYKLDEQTGTVAADYSGNDRSGSFVNVPIWIEGYPVPLGAGPLIL